ncbi:MAG TPA: hypothetical protein VIV12_23775 [Streptosporangiaceae bacterium]
MGFVALMTWFMTDDRSELTVADLTRLTIQDAAGADQDLPLRGR